MLERELKFLVTDDQALGDLESVLERAAAKAELDPRGILNPGVLLDAPRR